MIVEMSQASFLLENVFRIFLMLIVGVLRRIKGEEMIAPRFFV